MRLNCQRVIQFVGLVAFVFILLLPTLALAEVDITDKVEIIKGRMISDRATGDALIDVSIRNVSSDTLVYPLKMVIKDLTANVDVGNADGYTSEGEPYFDYFGLESYLETNEYTEPKRWVFVNPTRVRFSYAINVYATLIADSSSVAEMIIDSAGGEVETLNGAVISFDEHALVESTNITVGSLPLEQLIGNKRTVGKIDFGPSGTQFQNPVFCVMPIANTLPPGKIIEINYFNEASNSLEPYSYFDGSRSFGVVLGGGDKVAFLVDHFSTYYASNVVPTGVASFMDGDRQIKAYLPNSAYDDKIINGSIIPYNKGLMDSEYRMEKYYSVLKEIFFKEANEDPKRTEIIEKYLLAIETEFSFLDLSFSVSEPFFSEEVRELFTSVKTIVYNQYPTGYNEVFEISPSLELSVNQAFDSLSKLLFVLQGSKILGGHFYDVIKSAFMSDVKFNSSIENIRAFNRILDQGLNGDLQIFENNELTIIGADSSFRDALTKLEIDLTNERDKNRGVFKNIFINIPLDSAESFIEDNFLNLSAFATQGGLLVLGAIPPVAILTSLSFNLYENFDIDLQQAVDRSIMSTIDRQALSLDEDIVHSAIHGSWDAIDEDFHKEVFDATDFKLKNSLIFLDSYLAALKNLDATGVSIALHWLANKIVDIIDGDENIIENSIEYITLQREEILSDIELLYANKPNLKLYYRDMDGDYCSNGDTLIAYNSHLNFYDKNTLLGIAIDCNDEDSSIYPGAPEICGDGIIQDCLRSEDLICNYVSISGQVIDSQTSQGISAAIVSTSLDSTTATTDANGYFDLQTQTEANYSTTPYTVNVSAVGYQAHSVELVWGNHSEGQSISVEPKTPELYPNLQGCYNGYTGLSYSQIESLSSVVFFTCSGAGISSIDGLQNFTSLRYFYAPKNLISDLSPLQNLTNLFSLALDYNRISDLSPLQNLTSLQTLNLFANNISDVTPLQNLTSLQTLYLASNNPSIDLSPLQNLTSLRTLSLYSNNISDLSPLQNLTSLQSLSLWNNQISDLSPLQNLTSLQSLLLSGNQISDLFPLQNLTSLRTLLLSGNQISDLSPLINMTALSYLDVMRNYITDFTPLDGLSLYRLDKLPQNE